jgi:hypothetical protein
MTRTRSVAIVLIAVFLLGSSVPNPAWAQKAPPATEASGSDGDVAAGFSNVFYIPGKAIFCGVSGFLWVTIMFFTFGHSYDAAAHLVSGGCGGKWVLHGEDFRPGTSH